MEDSAAMVERLQQELLQYRREKERLLQENQQMKTQFPSFAELARQPIVIRNETASSSHTNTGHRKASYSVMKIPTVDLPESFWGYRTGFRFPEQINGEPGVNAKVMALLEEITFALGLNNYIHVMLDVPIMDTAPDASLVTKKNKVIFGSVEGKKPPKTTEENEKIYGSNTEVAGEAFEQLFLVYLQNKTNAVGLLTTLESFQLISFHDVGRRILSASDAKEFFEAKKSGSPAVTPDRLKVLADAKKPSAPFATAASKGTRVQTTAAPPKRKKTKHGRVNVEITNTAHAREFFATEPLSFGADEAQNQKVFKLLAAYVLLCVESLKETPDRPLDLTVPGVACLTREVRVQAETFSFKQIRLPDGVRFDKNPKRSESAFYVIRQLGYGQSGACCFACTSSCAPCVIKFFRRGACFEDVKEEADTWKCLYGELGCSFVKAYEKTRVFLVMPFLRVPSTLVERKKFVEGDEKSLLYKALQHVSAKGFIHREVSWHHVGLIGVRDSSGDDESCQANGGFFSWLRQLTNHTDTEADMVDIAVFCDLEHAVRCDDETERNQWIKSSFKNMKQGMGEEPNHQNGNGAAVASA